MERTTDSNKIYDNFVNVILYSLMLFKAVLAMTMHLQCAHKLKKDDSIYKNAMKMHRPYEGKTKEVKSCKRKAENQPMSCQSKK